MQNALFKPTQWLPFALLICIPAYLVWFPLTNTDYWWHLAIGRQMIQQQSFLYHDIFNWTQTQTPWINVHWLWQLITYAGHSSIGLKAMLILKGLLYGTSILVLYQAFHLYKSKYAIVFLLVPVVYTMKFLVLLRPTLLSLFFIALFIWVYETKPNKKYLLIILQILWANSQGLYILGPLIATAYALQWAIHQPKGVNTKDFWKPFFFPVLLWLSCIINPNGWHLLLYPFRLLFRISPEHKNIFSVNVSENIPLFQLFSTNEAHLAWLGVLLFAIGIVLFILNRAWQKHIAVSFLFGCFFILSLMANRNLLLFGTLAVPIIGHWFQSYIFNKKITFPIAGFSQTPGLIVLITVFGIAHYQNTQAYAHSTISPFRYPIAAAQWMEQHPSSGQLFNGIRDGGYINWALGPAVQTSIDGRIILRSASTFAHFLELLNNPPSFWEWAPTQNIQRVLLPTALYPRYHPLAASLLLHKDWKLVWWDGIYALFEPQHSPNPSVPWYAKGFLDSLASQTFSNEETPYLHKELSMHISVFINAVHKLQTSLKHNEHLNHSLIVTNGYEL
jgi:hypothetical protein